MEDLITLYSLAVISYYDIHHRLISVTCNNQTAEFCRYKNRNTIALIGRPAGQQQHYICRPATSSGEGLQNLLSFNGFHLQSMTRKPSRSYPSFLRQNKGRRLSISPIILSMYSPIFFFKKLTDLHKIW